MRARELRNYLIQKHKAIADDETAPLRLRIAAMRELKLIHAAMDKQNEKRREKYAGKKKSKPATKKSAADLLGN